MTSENSNPEPERPPILEWLENLIQTPPHVKGEPEPEPEPEPEDDLPAPIEALLRGLGIDPDTVERETITLPSGRIAQGITVDITSQMREAFSSSIPGGGFIGDQPNWWVGDPYIPPAFPGGDWSPPFTTWTTTFDQSDPEPEGVILDGDEMMRAGTVCAVLNETDGLTDGIGEVQHYISEVVIRKPNGDIAGSVIKHDGRWVYNKDNA